ncbi:unnamed protein product [Chrysodeixis includens]|uniref:Codanin-1 C-terminal domain-containing protein n=1 Tax=Chrysodeixis includens TaxID=689277 RepID=A0A9N8L6C8_CHRIL|nr:unnamed protein product [Chrysodeixis includens]
MVWYQDSVQLGASRSSLRARVKALLACGAAPANHRHLAAHLTLHLLAHCLPASAQVHTTYYTHMYRPPPRRASHAAPAGALPARQRTGTHNILHTHVPPPRRASHAAPAGALPARQRTGTHNILHTHVPPATSPRISRCTCWRTACPPAHRYTQPCWRTACPPAHRYTQHITHTCTARHLAAHLTLHLLAHCLPASAQVHTTYYTHMYRHLAAHLTLHLLAHCLPASAQVHTTYYTHMYRHPPRISRCTCGAHTTYYTHMYRHPRIHADRTACPPAHRYTQHITHTCTATSPRISRCTCWRTACPPAHRYTQHITHTCTARPPAAHLTLHLLAHCLPASAQVHTTYYTHMYRPPPRRASHAAPAGALPARQRTGTHNILHTHVPPPRRASHAAPAGALPARQRTGTHNILHTHVPPATSPRISRCTCWRTACPPAHRYTQHITHTCTAASPRISRCTCWRTACPPAHRYTQHITHTCTARHLAAHLTLHLLAHCLPASAQVHTTYYTHMYRHLAAHLTLHLLAHCLPASAQESKLSKLQRRLTCPTAPESHRLPHFTDQETFYKEFIINAENEAFRAHLRDSIASEITALDSTHIATDDRGNYNAETTSQYLTLSKKLSLLSKFLGLLSALPYTQVVSEVSSKGPKVVQRESNAPPKEKVLENDLALRNYKKKEFRKIFGFFGYKLKKNNKGELCPHLRDLNVLLSTCRVSQEQKEMGSYRHITPVSLILNPEDRIKNKEKELQSRLEEELLKSQPSSTRRVLELVIERVTSACIRELSGQLLTEHRQRASAMAAIVVAGSTMDQAALLTAVQTVYTTQLACLVTEARCTGRLSLTARARGAVSALLAAAPAPLVAL